MPKSRDVAVGERLLAHIEAGTTDRTEEVLRLPASYYLDPALFEREIENVFKRLPLLLGFTAELREPGAYKAIDVVGVPVLLWRGQDGRVRAFANACRHRGARLKEQGHGRCRNVVCPYHGWTYDSAGALQRIYKPELFGDVERSRHGLVELPCQEVAGLVFAVLTAGRELDVRDWLGGLLPDLEKLGMQDWEVYTTRELESANWKMTFDGYVDGYHIEVLHPKTVGLTSKGAVNTFDGFGPHMRIAFAGKDIGKLREIPTEAWQQDDGFIFIRTLFPNVSFAVREGVGGMVSQLLPLAPDRSKTIQVHLRAKLPESEEERKQVDQEVELLHVTVRDEDYTTVAGVQQGLSSGAIPEVLFGRNEVGNQRVHRWIQHFTQDDPRPEDAPRI